MSLDTQQTSIPQEKPQEGNNKPKQMDVDNKSKLEAGSPKQQESTTTNSSSSQSTANKEFNEYVKMLKEKTIDITSNKTHPSFLKTFMKLKKAADEENKKFVTYAEQLKATNMPLDETFVNLIKSNASATTEQLKFNEFVACNVALLAKTTEENRKLKEELENNNKKRLHEISEPPKKKVKYNDDSSRNDSQNNNNFSTFIPYGDKNNLQNSRSADLFLKQLLNPSGYFPKFDNGSTEYNESIINGSNHIGSRPVDYFDISSGK